VGAEWTEDGKRGGALRFDGTGHLAVSGLGHVEAASVTLWVRPDSLNDRWNPLLFTNEGPSGALHFSLLTEGAANVAINTGGGWNWVHHRANTCFEPGQWRHLAVVCDPRYGGTIRFYVDGTRDAESPLDVGLPLDLDDFRIGAWSQWEKSPANNFHGTLDEIRIYRGMLSDQQVAQLARPPAVAQRLEQSTETER
jgi:hypothetical protein